MPSGDSFMAALTGINKIWLWQLVDGHWQWLRVAPPPPPPAGPPPKAPPGPRQTRSQRALQKSFASSTDIWPVLGEDLGMAVECHTLQDGDLLDHQKVFP